ncbi:MAG: succinate--CoA ligase subunit beta [Armatimonadetes bacterium CG2_30_59_28]|nr:ADP-forming succinate--CoA ligase subunit beta [Armatimonadota bacterium]OIO94908.1 MAG: succinate--CoA ligase subunit beta [Armatimonadetes bacterium CG2_30_59_28]PIU60752.1 MAG: ADP-forming succinate--CoA ligase subunit beta [Armatimonadetes bacterium CG07_land_8_20_14_0_80_59_28]PIX43938.1 MAG: ADP-forming succinate--CoA ligase subunit beta [Armatimonadetes bacterium CG_4_8_14_3_um_filter_58_9]PJB62647.1 MAG: ADP-forming succinate--CoA ligase subunit beta [Armatimonadetes bacterium CG_4_9
MKIHEYQAKQILAKYQVPIPQGDIAATPEEAAAIAGKLGKRVVVKAQVHVGGRGKAGGVKLADTPDEAQAAASQILGMDIKGLTVEKVLVEEAADIAEEYYLGITIDRAARRNVVMVSAVGGVDIEEVAATTPEKIAKVHLDPAIGMMDFHTRILAIEAGLNPAAIRPASGFLKALYRAYMDVDASLAEINPLVLTAGGNLIATDAKINIDDNALFRQTKLAELREEQEEDPIEAEAHRKGLIYVRLDGNIGILGNGAGLVMTTLDVVQREGGRPANFLDVGGGAKAELVRSALETVLLDTNVKGVLFNIFGGITRCDEVAKGILDATAAMDINVPIVIRLTGTREREGQQLLQGTHLIPAASMQEAAQKIVELVSHAGKATFP